MASSLNKVMLIGNVGKDPEVRTTTEGKKIVSFPLATSEVWKDKMSGEKKEKTEWHRVVIFSEPLANLAETYIKKGSKLYLEGSLQTRKWSDNSGLERYTTEVVLQSYNSAITMLDSRTNEGASNMVEPGNKPKGKSEDFNYDDLDDDIPF